MAQGDFKVPKSVTKLQSQQLKTNAQHTITRSVQSEGKNKMRNDMALRFGRRGPTDHFHHQGRKSGRDRRQVALLVAGRRGQKILLDYVKQKTSISS